jgi:cytosine/uracil/thiamine/allantoin permease
MKKQAKKKPAAKKKRQRETGKTVVWVCLLNGFAWVWCSYALAFLDKTQIAESLSQVAVTEIIGVVLVYCLKSTVENLSKNNAWPDKTAKAVPEPEATAEETDDAAVG